MSLNPYKIILKQKIVKGFESFSNGDYRPLLDLYDENVHQIFEGNHALGGERFTKAGVELWFQRFIRLLPSKFVLKDFIISGGPWNTDVVFEFQDTVSPKFGESYLNHGILRGKIVWGKAKLIHIYVDTAKVENALKILAENGVEEAAAEPVKDP